MESRSIRRDQELQPVWFELSIQGTIFLLASIHATALLLLLIDANIALQFWASACVF